MSRYDVSEFWKKREEEKKKKEQESATHTSSKTTSKYDVSEFWAKREGEKIIGFDTFSDDLNAMNSTVNGIYDGWQDAETMKNTRSSVEGMYNRLLSYEDYRKNYGDEKFTDLSELVGQYKSALDGWDDRANKYAMYKNADAYNNEMKKLSELYSMSSSDIEPYLGNQDSAIAYTTADGYNIKWQDLYDSAYKSEYEQEIDSKIDINELGKYEKKDVEYQQPSIFGVEFGIAVPSSSFAHQYNYINGDEDARHHETMVGIEMMRTNDSAKDAYYTDEEKMRFNAIAKELGEDEALKYANLLNDELRERRVQHEKEMNKAEATESPFGTSVVSVGVNLFNNAMALPLMGIDYAEDGSIDPNSSLYTHRRTVNDWRSTVEDNIESDVGKFFYRHGMSAADNVAAMTISGFGKYGAVSKVIQTGLMSSGSFVDTTIDAKERGLSDKDALTLGTIAGATEIIFESKGYEALFGAESMSKGAWDYLVNNLATELGGELSTEATNDVADFLVAQDMSQWKLSVDEYMASGMTEKEALSKTIKDYALKYVDIAAGTLFSSAIISGPSAINLHSANVRTGKDIRESGLANDVFDMANDSEFTDAYNAYTAYAKKGINADNIKDSQLGGLYRSMNYEAQEGFKSANKDIDKAKKTIEKQKSIRESGLYADTDVQYRNATNNLDKAIAKQTDAQVRRLNNAEALSKLGNIENDIFATKYNKVKPEVEAKKLFGDKKKVNALIDNALSRGKDTEAYKLATEYKAKLEGGKELSEKELTKLVDATTSEVKGSTRADVEKRLVELGETENATELSEIISKASVGQKLSSAEIEMLESNENASKVFSEMDKSSNVELMEAAEGVESSYRELFLETYDGHTDIDYYQASFNYVSDLAKKNFSPDYILAHKYGLSERQVEHIYERLVGEPLVTRQKALDELVAKHEGKLTKKAVIDDSIFNGKNGRKLWRNLNSRQKQAIMFAKAFAKGAGVNLKITYNGKLKGKEYNGYYDGKTNTIVIDARAGFNARYTKDAIIPTMSHELTHWMKQKSPELYAELSRKIFGVLTEARGISELDFIEEEKASHPELTDDGARDEIIARACEDLFSMSETGREIFNSLSAEEQNTLKARIKEIVNNILDWVNKLLGMYQSNSPEANILRKYEAELQEIAKIWDQMLAKSIETNAALEAEGIRAEEIANEATQKVGIGVDMETKSAYPSEQLSEKTWTHSEYVENREVAVNALVKAIGVTKSEAEKIGRAHV